MGVPDREYYDISMREFRLLEEISDHPNIIKAYDIYYNTMREEIYMLMEYAGDGCDLMKFIKRANEEERVITD